MQSNGAPPQKKTSLFNKIVLFVVVAGLTVPLIPFLFCLTIFNPILGIAIIAGIVWLVIWIRKPKKQKTQMTTGQLTTILMDVFDRRVLLLAAILILAAVVIAPDQFVQANTCPNFAGI